MEFEFSERSLVLRQAQDEGAASANLTLSLSKHALRHAQGEGTGA